MTNKKRRKAREIQRLSGVSFRAVLAFIDANPGRNIPDLVSMLQARKPGGRVIEPATPDKGEPS